MTFPRNVSFSIVKMSKRVVIFNGEFAIEVDSPSNTAAQAEAWRILKSIPNAEFGPPDEGGLDVEEVYEN